MSGTLLIPNSIGEQPGPRIQAALFDQNWAEIAAYVNGRQVTFDVLANLPASAVSLAGQYFYATDTGTFYVFNGADWISLTSATGGTGASPLASSLNQVSVYLSATTFQLTAEAVITVNSTTGVVHTHNPVSNLTVDLTVVGANGRDQAAALSANSWAYLYWIYNPTTFLLRGLVSAAPWPGSLPTLPSGYTEICYAGAVRLTAGAQFQLQGIAAQWTRWGTAVAVLSAGTASAITAVDISAAIPPNALAVQGTLFMQNSADPGGLVNVRGQILYSATFPASVVGMVAYKLASGATNGSADASFFEMGNIGQSLSYQVTDFAGAAVAGTNQLTVAITGYENPNGGG
jgi:hypothetical protein